MSATEELSVILESVRGDRATMTVQVVSTEWGRQYTVNGYRADGAETTLPYDERIRFTESEFMAALDAAGWGMTERPVKLPGLNHRYILKRGAVSAYTPRSTTAEEVDRQQREARIAEIAAVDAGANADILRGLPAEVQTAIYRNAGLSR